MRLGRHTNGVSCEYDMQDELEKWLIEREIPYIREFYVSAVSRRPDFLLMLPEKGLVNIEAKCNNHDEMLNQLNDNSVYCRYSFAYIPDYCLTTIDFKSRWIKSTYGLLIYNLDKQIVTEVFEAHLNVNINKELYRNIFSIVQKAIMMKNKATEPEQYKLF